MGILTVLLLLQVVYVHETGVVLYLWVAACAAACAASVIGAVGVRRQATARPVPAPRPVPVPATARPASAAGITPLVAAALAHHAAAAVLDGGGRHTLAPGRRSVAALVGRLDEPTLAHGVAAEDLAAAAAAARAGVR